MPNIKFFFLLAGFIVLVTANAAAWASNCYTSEEAEAEQGIRIHSELMVIALNCQHMEGQGGKKLYSMYREFTDKHEKALVGYESKLMNYFKRQGVRNPEAAINTMRTRFSNTASYNAAHTRTDVFCSQFAPRITEVSGMADDDFRAWAATPYAGNPLSQPSCD